ncbi:acetoacetyl-CoA synthetase [Caerostris extrusa]|uniref:Acetoacetyl-CoA synthetase n=1 Tax=Caerostris extrusa TaxID=172846 RepID=A0AAV4PIU5_CAEEX|nr:acetoacetyl-CoA synthetase [Caerostris extrusa]
MSFFFLFTSGETKTTKGYRTHISKYEGVWCQNDECWINPKTKGLVVIGRSDDTMSQHGELMSASDIYFAIDGIEELSDYICVSQMWEEEERYNLNNKRMESVVRKIVATNEVPEVANIKNPESLHYFVNIPELVPDEKIHAT